MDTALDEQIAALREQVLALDHAYQLAWGSGDPRSIKATEAAYQLAFEHLGRLVKRKLQRGANG